jgi:hypothetical protein
MDWTMERQDIISISEAPGLTRNVTVHCLEHTHWTAVFTAECGFSSAARLKRLFPFPFRARIEAVIVRENDDWGASMSKCRS